MSLPWHEMLLRLFIAAVYGLMVGMERERRHRPAGIKTHILVCVGASLVSLIQIKMVNEVIGLVQNDQLLAATLKSDYGRLGAQVISGVGFLGAGTILRNKGAIKGLTTAATLWLIACVGLAVGMGYYLISVMAITITMIVLTILHLVQNQLLKSRGVKRIDITMSNKREAMNFINDYCVSYNILIKNIELNDVNSHPDDEGLVDYNLTYSYRFLLPRSVLVENLLIDLQMNEYILSASDVSDSFSV